MEDSISTLRDCLFILINSFNAVLDRLDIIAERQEMLLETNETLFNKVKEEYFKKIIENEVDLETVKNMKAKNGSTKVGYDVIRKTKNNRG